MPSLPIPSAPDRLAVEHLAIVQAAAKWLGVPSTDTVRDDLVSAGQEALIMASRRFEPAKASFSTYAGRRVVGSMLNVLADSPRAPGYWYLSDDEPPVQELAVAPDAERSALTSEVMAALGKLPPASQDLIRAHYLEERTLAAVATRHGLSKTRTWARLSLALEQLRAHLHDDCSTWPRRAKTSKRRFSRRVKAQVLRRVRHSRTSLSQLARDLAIPRTTIITWLRSSQSRLAS